MEKFTEKDFLRVLAMLTIDKVEKIREYVQHNGKEWYNTRPDLVHLCETYRNEFNTYVLFFGDMCAEHSRSRAVGIATAIETLAYGKWWAESHKNLTISEDK